MNIREPSIAEAFELKTLMDAGVTVRREDLTLEQWDLIGLIESERNRLTIREQNKAEAEARRLNM